MLVYLAGPLTPKGEYTCEQNCQAALDVYFTLIKDGVNCLCPHLGATNPMAFEINYERWMAYDFALIDVCTHVLMLPRWETSPGACREHAYAKQKGKTVLYEWPTALV